MDSPHAQFRAEKYRRRNGEGSSIGGGAAASPTAVMRTPKKIKPRKKRRDDKKEWRRWHRENEKQMKREERSVKTKLGKRQARGGERIPDPAAAAEDVRSPSLAAAGRPQKRSRPVQQPSSTGRFMGNIEKEGRLACERERRLRFAREEQQRWRAEDEERQRQQRAQQRAAPKGACRKCGRPLVPIGHARANGAGHADWGAREYHKKCWKEVCTEYRALLDDVDRDVLSPVVSAVQEIRENCGMEPPPYFFRYNTEYDWAQHSRVAGRYGGDVATQQRGEYRLDFGKHEGTLFPEVPEGYKDWAMSPKQLQNPGRKLARFQRAIRQERVCAQRAARR